MTTTAHELPNAGAANRIGPWRILIGYGIRLAICEMLCVAVTIWLVFGVPKYREVFKDFKTTLPALTEVVLGISDVVANYYGWALLVVVVPWVLPLPVALIELACGEKTARVLRRTYTVLLIIGMLMVVGMMALAVYLPYLKLVESVRGGEMGGGG